MTSTTGLVSAPEPSAGALIKTDVLGRLHRTREQILDEYELSGLSGPKFAALCGVKYQTFATSPEGGDPVKPLLLYTNLGSNFFRRVWYISLGSHR